MRRNQWQFCYVVKNACIDVNAMFKMQQLATLFLACLFCFSISWNKATDSHAFLLSLQISGINCCPFFCRFADKNPRFHIENRLSIFMYKYGQVMCIQHFRDCAAMEICVFKERRTMSLDVRIDTNHIKFFPLYFLHPNNTLGQWSPNGKTVTNEKRCYSDLWSFWFHGYLTSLEYIASRKPTIENSSFDI